MKIKVRKDSIAGSKTISLSDSLRYLSIMPDYGYKTISFWKGRGITSDNIFGQGKTGDGHSALCLPVNINFTGETTKVTVSTRVWASNPSNHSFRWAISNYVIDWLCQGHGAASDSGDIIAAQGLFTVTIGGVHIETFTFPVNGLSSGQFYIYWWPDNTNYGNVHVSGNFTVTVYTATGAMQTYDATPYIWKNNEGWKRATARVYKKSSGSWVSG